MNKFIQKLGITYFRKKQTHIEADTQIDRRTHRQTDTQADTLSKTDTQAVRQTFRGYNNNNPCARYIAKCSY